MLQPRLKFGEVRRWLSSYKREAQFIAAKWKTRGCFIRKLLHQLGPASAGRINEEMKRVTSIGR
ncbi:hypothetical protein B5M44_25590 [Shinella sumterensis]|nr:hypothetical protein B5M44_25590 [Shinella sumterensis]